MREEARADGGKCGRTGTAGLGRMTNELDLFAAAIPPDLLKRAYKSRNELAWARPDAIEAIDQLEKAGLTILGVDVWSPSPRGPIVSPHFVYDWMAGARNTVPGWPRSAQEFVRTFDWDPDDTVCKGLELYFNLAVKDQRD